MGGIWFFLYAYWFYPVLGLEKHQAECGKISGRWCFDWRNCLCGANANRLIRLPNDVVFSVGVYHEE